MNLDEMEDLIKKVGSTKIQILDACLKPKRWVDLKEITGIADTTLHTHIIDLMKLRLLDKDEERLTYLTNDRGVEFLKLEPREMTQGGKRPIELRRMVERGIKLGDMKLKERFEFEFLGLDGIRLDKNLQKVYSDTITALRKSVTVWLPPEIQTDKNTGQLIHKLIGSITKLNPDKKSGKISIIIEFDLEPALDLAIREENDPIIRKRLERDKSKILNTIYKNWHRIYR